MSVRLPLAVAVSTGTLVLISFFLQNPLLERMTSTITTWVSVLAAFALFLGIWNLIRRHGMYVRVRTPGWQHSLLILAALGLTLSVGLWPGSAGPVEPAGSWGFRYVYLPLNATVFSLLAFFAASAAYRALRLRSLSSALLLVVAVIVMLGQVPVGFQIWPDLPLLKDWLMEVPVAAAVRGIVLGVALGTVTTGLRVLLGQDRPYQGGRKP